MAISKLIFKCCLSQNQSVIHTIICTDIPEYKEYGEKRKMQIIKSFPFFKDTHLLLSWLP